MVTLCTFARKHNWKINVFTVEHFPHKIEFCKIIQGEIHIHTSGYSDIVQIV